MKKHHRHRPIVIILHPGEKILVKCEKKHRCHR
ncbi:hypothetical protein J2S04_000115 [Alicyclobacillus tengchongensis]|uniref:Uncharacterized protein n=1 Tax=Alicyclobacillus tolerans TaxID=90970 RepID=A0ABT9LSF3_9BACL|nr:hypothetical protein [Alicyclobacillus tengchongensis]